MSLYAVVLLKVGGVGGGCEKLIKFGHGELASLNKDEKRGAAVIRLL